MSFENVLFLNPRESDRATVTASTAVPSLPAANVQNQEPSRILRTTSAIDQYIDFVATQPYPWNAVAMSAFVMSSSGVWRLQAFEAAEDFGATPICDSGWQSVWPNGEKHTDPDWGAECALLRIDND